MPKNQSKTVSNSKPERTLPGKLSKNRIVLYVPNDVRQQFEELYKQGYSVAGLTRRFISEGLQRMNDQKMK